MRQIKDVSLPQTREASEEPFARPVDTYVRPEQPLPSGTMKVMESILGIAPELQKYFNKQEEKHRTFSEAAGAKLYLQASEKGIERTPTAIKEAMRSGDLQAGAKYNKHVQNGIVKMQFQTHANNLKVNMAKWFQTAQVVDSDGQMKHISEIDDVEVFNSAFDQEVARLTQDATGGKYSPTLYQEIVAGPVRGIRENLMAAQIQNVANTTINKQRKAYTAYIDSQINPLIDANNIIGNQEGSTAALFDMYTTSNEAMMENQFDPALVQEMAYKDMLMRMNDVSVRGIEMLEGVAQMMPEIWNDTEKRANLQNMARSATSRRLQRDKEEYEAETFRQKVAVEDAIWDLATATKDGDILSIDIEDYEALRIQHPRMAGLIAAYIGDHMSAREAIQNGTTAMDPAQFNKYLIEAESGKMSQGKILQLAGQMSAAQREHLISRKRAYDADARSRREGTKKGYHRYTGDPEKLKEVLMTKVFIRDDYRNSGKDNQVAIEQEIEAILVEVYDEIVTAEAQYANDPLKASQVTSALIREYVSDELLADMIYSVNNAEPREIEPKNPKARGERYTNTIEKIESQSDVIPQFKAGIGQVALKVRNNPNYVLTAEDYKIFEHAYANRYKGMPDEKTRIHRDADEYVRSLKEMHKYK